MTLSGLCQGRKIGVLGTRVSNPAPQAVAFRLALLQSCPPSACADGQVESGATKMLVEDSGEEGSPTAMAMLYLSHGVTSNQKCLCPKI